MPTRNDIPSLAFNKVRPPSQVFPAYGHNLKAYEAIFCITTDNYVEQKASIFNAKITHRPRISKPPLPLSPGGPPRPPRNPRPGGPSMMLFVADTHVTNITSTKSFM